MTAYDPVAQEEARKIFTQGGIEYCDSIENTVVGVDAILLLTRWPEFKKLLNILKEQNASPLLVDGRRLIPSNSIARYEGIGI